MNYLVNKLIHHCILEMDALNKMKAVINLADQRMICTFNNIIQNMKFYITEENQSSNLNERTTISRPSVNYTNDKHTAKKAIVNTKRKNK